MIILREFAGILGKKLAGGVAFAAMKTLVADIESSELSGKEKREKVLADFQELGYNLATWIVETILQLACIYVKSL